MPTATTPTVRRSAVRAIDDPATLARAARIARAVRARRLQAEAAEGRSKSP